MGFERHSEKCTVLAAAYTADRIVSTQVRLRNRVASWSLASMLGSLAERVDAVGRGVRAFLFAWKVSHRNRLQWTHGKGYVESCPAYLAAMDGVTRWSAAQSWETLRSTVDWLEVSTLDALDLGVQLRTLPRGVRRGGRHLLLEPWMVQALDKVSGWTERPPGESVTVPVTRRVRQVLSSPGKRCVAVSCPHHKDRDPSMVLWSNGGGMCMSCGARVAWSFEQDSIRLFTSRNPSKKLDRYNLIPPQDTQDPRTGPVGGRVVTKSTRRTVVGAVLTEYRTPGGSWKRARSGGHVLRGDLLDVLQRADERSQRRTVVERVRVASQLVGDLPGRAAIPDLLVSVSCLGRESWKDAWESKLQRWVLVDLDDIDLDGASDLMRLAGDVISNEEEASGRYAIVRTSRTGLQVWVELAHARYSPSEWCADHRVRRWFADFSTKVLNAVRSGGASGGHVDPSSLAAGRFGRRPGWRWKNGHVYRAHLVGCEF